ncbi:MAG: baseplate J/gp47 family protein [Kofleriaceae bacterium]|nr:baseplate J/gp47 family protein [Kofleriaceae bacterium]MCL4225212.1 baseplate J/gp47 family protein [Myxococcales bacterium]
MSAAYLSWAEARLDGAWQGIRRLELALVGAPPAATVTVHLAQPPAGLRHADVVVEGPSVPTITGVTFGPGNTITIALGGIGSRATCWVRLLAGGAHPLHPLFAMASFQFAIDCEGADCRAPAEPAPRAERPAPPIDYTTRDYAGFRELLAVHARVRHDDWGDQAAAAQEQLLLELLAHHGDLLAYFQDRVGNEAFVATARTRHALRQHGLLLGHDVDEGRAATTLLAFAVTNPGWIPADLAVRSQTRDGDAPIHYATRARTPVRPEHNALGLAAWPGAHAAQIPPGTTRALLWGHDLGLVPGLRLALHAAAETFVVTLTAITELTLPGWVADPGAPAPDPVTDPPAAVTEVEWDARGAPPRALAPWLAADAGGDELVVQGNLVEAVFGEPRRAETAPHGPGVLALDRSARAITLEDAPGGGPPRVRALRAPEAPVVWEDQRDGRPAPALAVEIDGQAWHRQAHLHASRPFDRHYAVTVSDGGVHWLLFGDGVHGARVDAGAEIRLRYRRGHAGHANCPRGVLQLIDPPLDQGARDDLAALGPTTVTNPVPGAGGRAAESDAAVRESIPRSLRHAPPARAVTLADYAHAAEEVAGVARATARALGGIFNTVLVLVDPQGQLELDDTLRDAVHRHLDHLRMAGREHRVVAARYIPLDVELWLCAQPGVPRHHVRERALAALRPGHDARPGWFHPDRLSFAESVELGDVLALVQALPGVRSVKARRFRRLLAATGPAVEARVAMSATEVARLDADLTRPDHGRLRIEVVGLGDIDETAYDVAVAGGAP